MEGVVEVADTITTITIRTEPREEEKEEEEEGVIIAARADLPQPLLRRRCRAAMAVLRRLLRTPRRTG